MKILLLTRHNFYALNGGDKIQILATKAALEERGHTVVLANKLVRNLRSFDIVHLFNMQINPHALLIYALRAHRQSRPVALSTIYWNPKEWLEHEPPLKTADNSHHNLEKFYPFRGVAIPYLIQAFVLNPLFMHWLKLYLKHPGSGQASEFIKRQLVAQADIILPNGEAEAELVQHDYGRAKASLFVPNGVNDTTGRVDPQKPRHNYPKGNFILSVGRIETRKNALQLARAAAELKVPLVMIGNNTAEAAYTAQIKAVAPQTIFISEMPHEELGAAYRAAKVHALASWFETPGLSSLEAALCECNIVTTDRGTTKEYFGELAWYCDPTNHASIKMALAEALAAPKSSKLRDHILKNFSWGKAAEKTEAGYRKIIEAMRP